MRIDILSLFPDYFKGPFDQSIIARARQKNLLDIRLVNIRDFARNKHNRVDDRPYGGGPGMLLMPQPIVDALASVRSEGSYVVHLSPQGAMLNASCCQRLAHKKHLVLLCGHYEGIDQRIIDNHIDEEISIGDYVLTNGALASIVLVDAVVRFVPGVLGDATAAACDSFQDKLFDCAHYTQPEEFEGIPVPAALKSGDHAAIAKWRKESALQKTWEQRPDLFVQHLRSKAVDRDPCAIEQIIACGDLQKSIKFYCKKLGMTQLFADANVALLQREMLQLYLVQHIETEVRPQRYNGLMMGIAKSADFEQMARKLSKENNYYVNIDRSNHIIYCHDPDQHLWCFRLQQKQSTTVDETQ